MQKQFIDSPDDLAAFIRRRRKAVGLTQAQAAEMCGFSIKLVGEIERGRDTVGYGKVLRYLNVLGISLEASV